MSPPALKVYDGADDGPSDPPDASLPFAPIQDPDLSFRAAGMLWALCYWAWWKKSDCWPTNPQIARLVKCSPRTVQLGLSELIALGYIERWMEKTGTGWRRVLRITDRASPVKIFEGEDVAPGARSCATPLQDLAPPLAQDLAHKVLEIGQQEKTQLAIAGPGAEYRPRPASPGTGKDRERSPLPPPTMADLLTPAEFALNKRIASGGDSTRDAAVAIALINLSQHTRAVRALSEGLILVDETSAKEQPALGSIRQDCPESRRGDPHP